MKILDCESIDSTYASIEEILCIERPLLEEMLGNLDLDGACRRAGGKTGSEVLLEAVVKHARASPDFDKSSVTSSRRTRLPLIMYQAAPAAKPAAAARRTATRCIFAS